MNNIHANQKATTQACVPLMKGLRTKGMLGILLVFLAVLLTACGEADFVGNSYKVGNSITIEYQILNMTKTEEIDLRAGDTVQFDIISEAGDVDIDFGIKDAAPVYEGSSVGTNSFTVTVHEEGRYVLTVTGSDAKGSVQLTMKDE